MEIIIFFFVLIRFLDIIITLIYDSEKDNRRDKEW